jgi:hypothetical protein
MLVAPPDRLTVALEGAQCMAVVLQSIAGPSEWLEGSESPPAVV